MFLFLEDGVGDGVLSVWKFHFRLLSGTYYLQIVCNLAHRLKREREKEGEVVGTFPCS